MPLISYTPLYVMKHFHRYLIIFLLLVSALVSSPAHAASSIIVDNETGHILEEHGRDDRLPIASLTKVALAMVLLDWAKLSNTSLDTVVSIPPRVLPQGPANPMGLQPGDRLTLRDLLYLALLASDSEAAETIANTVGQRLPNPQQLGPMDNFVSNMNALARELQMKHTLFLNPTGLDAPASQTQPYSSPADLARLVRYAYSKPGLIFYVSQKSREIHVERAGKSFGVKIQNTNKLLGIDRIDGVKTGHTQHAGDCIILTSEHDPEVKREGNTVYTAPRRIIVVLLGSTDRFSEGLELIRRGWSLYDDWAATGRSSRSSQCL